MIKFLNLDNILLWRYNHCNKLLLQFYKDIVNRNG